MTHQTIIVLDFGSQFTQLIARRLRELSVYSEVWPPNTPIEKIRERNPAGVILSGGPKSVSDATAPKCDPAVYTLGRPVLGICYGMQLMADQLGGEVAPAPSREFGHAIVSVDRTLTALGSGHPAALFAGVPDELTVWASHGDFVAAAPTGFAVVATSANAPISAMADTERALYAILFHPEVVHTEHGLEILRNFAYGVCGCTGDWTMASFVEEATARVREKAGTGRIVCALSGGVDSTVAAVIIHRAVGKQLTCIFVDNGVLRHEEASQIRKRYERLHLPLVFVDASTLFLDRLAGVTDPEKKRKIIGATFIDVFEAEASKLGEVDFPRPGDALSRRDRVDLDRRPVVDDQEPPQCRRASRAHAHDADRAAARAVQGRGAGGRPQAGARRGVRRAPAVPRAGSCRPDPRRGHAGRGSRCCRRRTRSCPRK